MKTRCTPRGALLLLAAAALAASACKKPKSDDQLIRAVFSRAAKAAEEKRPGDVVADVSERFRAGELDRDGVRRTVAGVILRGGWLSASIAGANVTVEGDLASAVVDVILARAAGTASLSNLAPGEGSVHRFDVRLAREPDGWRVTAARWAPVELPDALAGPPDPSPPSEPLD